jgi:hypothetical protein
MGRQHQRSGTVGESPLTERYHHTLRRIVSKNHRTAAEVTEELNIQFVDPRKFSDVSFTNPTSTVGMQLPDLC